MQQLAWTRFYTFPNGMMDKARTELGNKREQLDQVQLQLELGFILIKVNCITLMVTN